MAWIETIEFDAATGRLKSIYESIAGRRRRVDNVLSIHSLRPHTLTGHLALYKSVLHHTGNRLPYWFLESIGVLVSRLNGCTYCADHHEAGLRRAIGEQALADRLLEALNMGAFDTEFTAGQAEALRYVVALTESPADVTESLVQSMRSAGLSDGEILEVNQVAAYFAYANRTVDGLGVTTEGDELGLSPPASEDLEDLEHD